MFQPATRKQQTQKFRQKKSNSPLQPIPKKTKYILLPHRAKQNAENVVADKLSVNFKDSAVYIKKSALNLMINHCQQDSPYEACGLLSGMREKNETLWKMKNIERTPTSFAMDVNQMSQVFKKMKQQGEEWTGIYHSHPTAPPIPSRNDIVHAHYPDVAYFIVSLKMGKPNVKCYRINKDQVTPLKIIVLD